ncbi:cysteine proteinase [Trametopsis cervina]|nr:cysteine proteinase [Trametopsis cervina]
MQQLLESEASKRPLISASLPLSSLREEYERGAGHFVRQIDWLAAQGYTHVRRTRGDGDCFYRSLAFAWLARLMSAPDKDVAVSLALSLLEASLDVLRAAGFQPLVFEDFYDVLAALVRAVAVADPSSGTPLTPATLLQAFQDPETSNCIVVFLRMLTSAVIRTDADSYAPFLVHPDTGADIVPHEFCERFVEATGKEADHIQISALTKALRTPVRVAYLDGHAPDSVNFVDFVHHDIDDGGEAQDQVRETVLLYRPGHYDILEKQATG